MSDLGDPNKAATYAEFSHACIHESMAKNNKWNAESRGFDMPCWDYSDEALTLSFSEHGEVKVICEVLVAGTTLHSRWQWSWANKSADPRNQTATLPIREYGVQTSWSELTTGFTDADEYTGWEHVSIASHVLGGVATYRFAYGENNEFVAYIVIRSARKV